MRSRFWRSSATPNRDTFILDGTISSNERPLFSILAVQIIDFPFHLTNLHRQFAHLPKIVAIGFEHELRLYFFNAVSFLMICASSFSMRAFPCARSLPVLLFLVVVGSSRRFLLDAVGLAISPLLVFPTDFFEKFIVRGIEDINFAAVKNDEFGGPGSAGCLHCG